MSNIRSRKKVIFHIFLCLVMMGIRAQAQTDSLLDSYIEKVGGKEAWATIKSFKMEMIGEFGDQMSVSEHYMLKPHCFKIVFMLTSGTETLAYDGHKGQMERKGVLEKMPEGMRYEMHEEADFFDELIFHKERGYSIKRQKDTLIKNQNYAKFTMHKSEWDLQHYYINTKTQLLEMVEEHSAEQQYKGVLFKTVFSEYRKVGKVLFPKKMALFGNNKLLVDFEITEVIWNPVLRLEDFRLTPK